MRLGLICLCLWLLSAGVCARAAGCTGPFPVAYRTIAMADGRDVSVWYPTTTGPKSGVSGEEESSRRVQGVAPVLTCERWPLVLFSHGIAGCATQVEFLTEGIARQGYVVAAPNHHDAICGKVVPEKSGPRDDSTHPSLLDPALWDEHARRDRMLDLRETVRLVVGDGELGHATDPSRIGLMGHSLGGYTVVGIAGGWPDWSMPGVRAVIAMSPYVAPFVAQHRLSRLKAPVMYQGGTLDIGLTPTVEGADGAYAQSPTPKFFVDLSGATHVAWTDWECGGRDSVTACLAGSPNARLIDAYALAFLDRYLKGLPAPLLDGKGAGLASYRSAK